MWGIKNNVAQVTIALPLEKSNKLKLIIFAQMFFDETLRYASITNPFKLTNNLYLFNVLFSNLFLLYN